VPHSAAKEASEVMRSGVTGCDQQGGGGVCTDWLKLDDLASGLRLTGSHGVATGWLTRVNWVDGRLLHPPVGLDLSML